MVRGSAVGESTGPTSYDALVALLHERMEGMSRSHLRIAERVLADPEGLAFMTVSDVAAAAEVNESTVVRFATGLGLKGYPGLTKLCRDKLSAEAQLLRRFGSVERQSDGDLLQRAADFDQANVARTLARVDAGEWQAVVELLAAAPRIHILGMRKVHSVAYLLAYLLGMVRDGVELVTPGAGTLIDGMRRVQPGDGFVGISIHRYMRDSVQTFRWAKDVGATTVALTDNAASPLARDADHVFYAETSGVGVMRSVTGFIALAQALANGVAVELGDAARDTLAREESLLDHFGVYE